MLSNNSWGNHGLTAQGMRVTGEGMQPFWMQSNAQASANEQAEMAAFCRAYAQTAAAVRSSSSSLNLLRPCVHVDVTHAMLR